jgi:hypothetical protein
MVINVVMMTLREARRLPSAHKTNIAPLLKMDALARA